MEPRAERDDLEKKGLRAALPDGCGERLSEAEKGEIVPLVAGIACRFNDLLTVVNGYCDLVLADLGKDHAARHLLEEARAAGQRAAVLAGRLIALSGAHLSAALPPPDAGPRSGAHRP